MFNSFQSWPAWWFPGISEFLDMISLAFWWSIAIVIGAIPAVIVLGIIALIAFAAYTAYLANR